MSPVLSAVLERVRARLRVARLVSVAPWSAAAAAAATVIGNAAGLQGYSLLLVGLGTVLVSTVAALVAWGVARPLTVARVARFVDARLDQHDLFSTAIEVSADSGVLAAALHRDADRRARVVVPTNVVSVRWPRSGVAAGLAMCALCAASLGLGGAEVVPLDAPASVAEAVSVESVRTLAAAAQEAAEARRDPHLAALAKALEELADEADSLGEVSVTDTSTLAELVQALDRLAPAAFRRAGAPQPEAADPGLPPGIEPLPEAVSRLSETFAEVSERARMVGEDIFEYEMPFAETDFGARAGAVDGEFDLDGPPGGARDGAAQGIQQAPSEGVGEREGEVETAAIIGASADSVAGASSMAGQGTKDLFGEGAGSQVASSSEIETVSVAGTEVEDGRRVRVEYAPETSAEEAEALEFVLAPWQPHGLPSLAVSDLPHRFRSVAGRYFLPTQETIYR